MKNTPIKVNYIELINRFWQSDIEHCISPNDTRLYFYLLHTCNSLGWKQSFGHSDRFLSLTLGISVNTVREAKNRLKQRGLIDFKSPEKASKGMGGQTKYSFPNLPLIKERSVLTSVSNTDTDTCMDTCMDTCADTCMDTGNNTKLNKTKLNNIPPNPPRGNMEEKNFSEPKEQTAKSETPSADKIDFDKLLEFINTQTGRAFKKINDSVKKKFNARIKEGYTKNDIQIAVQNAVNNDFHKDNNFQYLTPEYFSRADTLDKFSQIKPMKKTDFIPGVHGFRGPFDV